MRSALDVWSGTPMGFLGVDNKKTNTVSRGFSEGKDQKNVWIFTYESSGWKIGRKVAIT